MARKTNITASRISEAIERFVEQQVKEEKDIWFLNAEVTRIGDQVFEIRLPRSPDEPPRYFTVKVSEHWA